ILPDGLVLRFGLRTPAAGGIEGGAGQPYVHVARVSGLERLDEAQRLPEVTLEIEPLETQEVETPDGSVLVGGFEGPARTLFEHAPRLIASAPLEERRREVRARVATVRRVSQERLERLDGTPPLVEPHEHVGE